MKKLGVTVQPPSSEVSTSSFYRAHLLPRLSSVPTSTNLHITATSYDAALPVDHLLLLVHGIGHAGTAQKFLAFADAIASIPSPSQIHVHAINWKVRVAETQEKLFRRVTPASPEGGLREFVNHHLADLAFYSSPKRRKELLAAVKEGLIDAVKSLKEKNPRKFRKSKITLVGHSLGSVIVHDVLNEDELDFPVHAFYMLGSPLGGYLAMQEGEDRAEVLLTLPRKINRFYNVFHAMDPVAFRVEPLFYGETEEDTAPAVSINKVEVIEGALPHQRRLDYVIAEQGSFLPGNLGMSMSMISAHTSYWRSKDVAGFVVRTLTGQQVNKT
jgi:hypothetical protein